MLRVELKKNDLNQCYLYIALIPTMFWRFLNQNPHQSLPFTVNSKPTIFLKTTKLKTIRSIKGSLRIMAFKEDRSAGCVDLFHFLILLVLPLSVTIEILKAFFFHEYLVASASTATLNCYAAATTSHSLAENCRRVKNHLQIIHCKKLEITP